MIANKVLPAFYLIDIDGDIADVFPLLERKFRTKRITLGSFNFPTDGHATVAGEDALEFFFANPQLTIDTNALTCEKQYNPEFYPTLNQDLALEDGELPPFDELGNFISYKVEMNAPNFNAQLKIGACPMTYTIEKEIEKVEESERYFGRLDNCQQLHVH
jgi:hypothetical protein